MKTCTRCNVAQTETEFYFRDKRKTTLRPICKSCSKKYCNYYQKKNRERFSSYKRNYSKDLRKKFLETYGTRCSCCEDSREFTLTLDHITPVGGWKKGLRRSSKAEYFKALQEYRPDVYQVLCYSCNHCKRALSKCPCGTKYGQ